MPKQKPKELDVRYLEKTKEPDSQIIVPVLFTGKTSGLILELCRHHLNDNKNSQASRSLLAALGFSLRIEAMMKFGHDSVESFAIAKLLGTVQGFQPKPPRPDALSYIQNAKRKEARLNIDQRAAADQIALVWDAFGKFLNMGARSLEGGGGNRTRALAPMDVMDQETYDEVYKKYFVPWYEVVKKITVARRIAGPLLTVAAVTFKVIVEDKYPDDIDRAFGLTKGMALRALKFGLRHYWNPDPARGTTDIKVPNPKGALINGVPQSGANSPQPKA